MNLNKCVELTHTHTHNKYISVMYYNLLIEFLYSQKVGHLPTTWRHVENSELGSFSTGF